MSSCRSILASSWPRTVWRVAVRAEAIRAEGETQAAAAAELNRRCTTQKNANTIRWSAMRSRPPSPPPAPGRADRLTEEVFEGVGLHGANDASPGFTVHSLRQSGPRGVEAHDSDRKRNRTPWFFSLHPELDWQNIHNHELVDERRKQHRTRKGVGQERIDGNVDGVCAASKVQVVEIWAVHLTWAVG